MGDLALAEFAAPPGCEANVSMSAWLPVTSASAMGVMMPFASGIRCPADRVAALSLQLARAF
ncbi:hypothetical protein MMRN_18190 [Mycobacterium marinum]|nr:hypothetical protein MMEU_5399 [Mycobacterium marinum str. Europe]BBC64923.1 hypothetical protein MMRN_18190 [Mycobacterium marinum]